MDMETGKGFKYPLSTIHQILGDSGFDGQSADISPNIDIMYDIVCKLSKPLDISLLNDLKVILKRLY